MLRRQTDGWEVTDARVRLVEGQVIRCSYSERDFGTVHRLDDVAQMRPNQTDVISEICPACRRKHLILKLGAAEPMT